MATRTAPATPTTPSAQRLAQQPATPTGNWKHPRFDEITRRQYASTFDERNVHTILFNGGLLFASFLAMRLFNSTLVRIALTNWYIRWSLYAFRLLLVVNISIALFPLVRRYYPDDISDIPLTPSQRQAMGLDPNVATPQTPGSGYASPNYVTPPRYQKSTPRSSFSTGERASHSPLSGSRIAKSTSNSAFSPNTGSPLFQKALGGGSATKRLSYDGRASPLNSSLFGDSTASNTPGTPTPGTGRASVGLNNKWLYEKRRDSPRSSLFN